MAAMRLLDGDEVTITIITTTTIITIITITITITILIIRSELPTGLEERLWHPVFPWR